MLYIANPYDAVVVELLRSEVGEPLQQIFPECAADAAVGQLDDPLGFLLEPGMGKLLFKRNLVTITVTNG